MSGRRLVITVIAGAAAIGLAAALIVMRRPGRPRLPASARYESLPSSFSAALEQARRKAEEPSGNGDATRDLARLYQANRLYPEAKACFAVVAAGPGGLTPKDHYLLAAIAEDESDLGAAEVELKATLAADPRYRPARLQLAEVFFKTGRPDEAAKEYQRVLSSEPDQTQAAFGLARIELQQGDETDAIDRLSRVMAKHPDSASAAALLANLEGRRGNTAEAAALKARSEETHEPIPSDPWLGGLLVDCYDLQRLGIAFEQLRLTGQIDQALPLLNRLQDLDPNGWIAPMLRGWSLKEAGRYPDAVAQYREALSKGGDPERICPLLAATLLTEHKPEEAESMLAGYRAKFPHSQPILLSSSEVAVWLKDRPLARSLLTEVLRTEPYLYMPNMSLFQLLWNEGQRDAAAECLKRVVLVYPGDLDARGLLAQYYMEKSDPWSAIAPLEQAVAVAPPKDERRERLTKMLDTAYLTAGSLEAARGRYADAVSYAEKSIRFVPDGVRGYALKANVCRRMRDFKGAAEALNKLASVKPGDPSVELSLGDSLYQEGDRDAARTHWEHALQAAPANASDLRNAISLRLAGHITTDTFN
ncbi:MAG TPA: tetratricopeptide repeat protein [Opitutaceae bacterium]|jgi:tetratricopeptide (TPR) repeat protein